MANFQNQIESLTDLTVGTNPSTGDITEYLKNGVVEVVNRVIELKPQEINKFTKEGEDTGSGVTQSGRVFNVVREHDSTTVLRPCTKIDPTQRYESTDVNSLHFRSKFNPGYYQLNGKIHVVPVAGSSGNKGLVSQVHYDQTVAYNTAADAIVNFPYEYEYLVVLYASMRSLQNKIGSMHSTAETALDRISDSLYNALDNRDLGTQRFKQVKIALDNAVKLFDGGYPSSTTDVSSFLKMEDPEMVKIGLEAIQTELAQVDAGIKELNVLADIPLKEAQGYMAEIASRVARYNELKAEYDGAFALMAPRQQQAQGAR